jgi:glutaredoxin-like YruB-family protein
VRPPLSVSVSICALLALSGCGIAKDAVQGSLVRAGAGAIAAKLFGTAASEGEEKPATTDFTIGASPSESRPEAAASADASDRGPGFYKVAEANGTIRFVSSLDDVPAAQRAKAERIAAGPTSDTRKKGPPSRHVVQQLTAAKTTPPASVAPSGSHEVVVYTTSWCGWCKKTRAWLDQKGVDYENRDVEANERWAEEMHDLTGSGGVPVVVIDGKVIQGFNQAEMEKLLRI